MRQKSIRCRVLAFFFPGLVAALALSPLKAQAQQTQSDASQTGGAKSASTQQALGAAPKSKRKPPSKPSKSSNVRNGEIVSIDLSAETLVLKERTGRAETYVFTPKTRFHKQKKTVELKDFKAGDPAVVHFRRSRTDGAMMLSEVDDPISWDWLAELKKTTVAATIQTIEEDILTVKLAKDGVEFEYSVSEKTRWEKAGAETSAEQFKAGDKVFVVPRSLPSGGVFARAVADTPGGADQGKERTATSVHGTILALEPAAYKITLKTAAGDTRNFAFNDETEVKKNSKPIPVTTLKPGEHVSARLRHEESGDELAWRITVETGRKTTTKTRKISTVKRRAPGSTATAQDAEIIEPMPLHPKTLPKRVRKEGEPATSPLTKAP